MNINLNNLFNFFGKPEVLADPATFNDPLALKTSWEPLKRGGSNVRTHMAVQEGANRIEFKPTVMMKILPLFVVLIPLIGSFLVVKQNIDTNGRLVFEKSMIWVPIVLLLFIGAAFLFYRANTMPAIFDQSYGYFWRGKRDEQGTPFNPAEQKIAVKLSDIHALQVIYEWVRSGGKNHSQYRSYELNLVLNSGERMNVIDHGNRQALLNDAKLLAQFLKVPLWDRTQVQQGIMN